MSTIVLRTVSATFFVTWLASSLTLVQAAQPPASSSGSKAGVVREWQALLSTRDGISAAEYLTSQTRPQKKRLEQMEADIKSDRATLTIEGRARFKWLPWCVAKRKALERRIARGGEVAEIARRAIEEERGRILAVLQARLLESVSAYSNQIGYSLSVDAEATITPHPSTLEDFTSRFVQFYDSTHPEPMRF
jgi:hypothetical protein